MSLADAKCLGVTSRLTVKLFAAFVTFACATMALAGCVATGGTGSSGPPTGSSVPSAANGLVATAGNAQVSLSWTTSAGATSYHVKRGAASGGPYTLVSSPTSTSFVDTGLSNSTKYFYVVSAVNSAGESANSAEVSATPSAPLATPTAPSGVIATAGDAAVNLVWNTSTGATSYHVKARDG